VQKNDNSVMQKFAVIGGGIAGCAAAYELHKKGHHVEILEQNHQIGGRTISFSQDKMFFNTGAAFFTNFYSRTKKYIAELDLQDHVVEGKNAEIYFVDQDRRVPFDVENISTFIKYPYLTAADKVLVGFKILGLKFRRLNYDWVDPEDLERDDFESVAQFAKRVFNDRIYQYLIKGSIEPYWYFSAEEVSASMAIALQVNAINAKFFTFKDGMDMLPRKIASLVPAQLNTKVESISMEGSRVVVQSSKGSQLYDGVVLATPASIASQLSHGLSCITSFQKEYLSSQKYLQQIVIGYSVPSDKLEEVSGEFHPHGDWNYGAAAVLVKGYKSSHQNVETVAVYLTRDFSEKIIDESSEEIARKGWLEARGLCQDLPLEFTDAKVVARKMAMPISEVGRFKAAAKFLRQQSGPIVFAGDYLTIPCIEGCIFTAQKAIASLLSTDVVQ